MIVKVYYYIFICVIMGIQSCLDKKKQRNCFSFSQKRRKMKMIYLYCPILHSSNLPVLRTHDVYQRQIALLCLLFHTYEVTGYFKNGV